MQIRHNYYFYNKHLNDYCIKNVNWEVYKRGEKYFFDNRVSAAINNDPNASIQKFWVKGSGGQYTVTVKDFDSEAISSSCNCPYDWGGICKHQVAVIIHLDGKLEGIQKKVTNKADAFIIENDELLSGFVQSYLEHNNINDRDFFLLTFQILKLLDKEVRCIVSESYFGRSTNFHITISNHANNVHVECTCNRKSTTLCLHQLFALKKLMEQKFFPAAIIPAENKKFAETILSNLGLSGKVLHSEVGNFILEKNNQIQFELKKELHGILSVKEDIRNSYRNFFINLGLVSNSIPVDIPELPTAENKQEANYTVAYALLNNEYASYFEIATIAGKLNKAGTSLVSNVCYYNNQCSFPITLSDDEEALIRLCNKISADQIENRLVQKGITDKTSYDYSDIKEKSHFMFQFLPDIVDRLSECPFVYNLNFKGAYPERPLFKRGDLFQIQIEKQRANFFYKLTEDDQFANLEPMIEIDGEEYSIKSKEISFCSYLFIQKGKSLYLLNGEYQALRLLVERYEYNHTKIVKEHINVLIEEFVIPISTHLEIKFDQINSYEMEEVKLSPVKRKLYISGEGNFVLFKPVVEYQKGIELEVLKRGVPVSLNGHVIHKHLRDQKFEDEFEKKFRELHPLFLKQYPYEFYNLKASQMIENFWFFDAFEKLQENNVEVYGLNDLKNFKFNPYKATIKTNLRAGNDWFEAEVEIAFGDNKITLNEVKKAILKHEKYIKLSDGSIGIIPQEWLDKFNRYLRFGEIKNNKIQISKTKFSLIDELFENINDAKVLTELADKRKKLESFEKINEVKLPEGITAQLRDYQKEGINWLNFLKDFRWGGILADDMGLGKTLQAITLLKQTSVNSKYPSLVVLPTTLIFNWQNELKKFCPSLKVLFHYGPDRIKSSSHFNEFDLVVTSYGLIINDIEFLKALHYNYIFLDESQAIKNPSSKRYKGVCILKADHRIAMTGTPIENGTFDIYAQLNFVNPGMLGNMKHFRENYALPIDRDGDKNRAAELQKIISPFILRRTKEQVATELPPKTEDVIYCTMDNEQRKIYDAYRNEIRSQLLNRIESEGIEKSKIHILEGLLKLRQICDSPALLSNVEDYGNDSVKIRELLKHITQKTTNHKIVIFSQFVKMLELIKSEIESINIDFEYLDGQCNQKQRKTSVDRFQKDVDCRVFLISLKAGGTGINLTAADYVYIVDPWWNPAVENQAIDRCYRIGQDKKVFAYRMICKDTIEEKITDYQNQKRAVANEIIQTDESFMKQLSKEDVLGIFG